MSEPLAAPSPSVSIDRELEGIDATVAFARSVAAEARERDLIALRGDLGAGKTTFARAFIEARAARHGRSVGEVPSPTFTLTQVYELDGETIWHFDLYRLERPEDAFELGIEDAFAEGVCLVEWPDRIEDILPEDRLDIAFFFTEAPGRRRVRVTGRAGWAARVPRLFGGRRRE